MNYRDRKYSEATVKAFASRVARRLMAAGAASITYQDVCQELWMAWWIAVQSYDPESGVPFLAYLSKGMRQHINRHIEKNVERRISEVHAISLDAPATAADRSPTPSTIHDAIPAPDPSPDDAIHEKQSIDRLQRRLSKDASLFLNLLYQQPPELLEEVRKIQARTEYARERGYQTLSVNRLTYAVIFDAMGVASSRRQKILREIESAVSKHVKAL